MGRPKVKPQDRQRSVKACTACRRSKIRCDGALPCGMCKRRSRKDSCTYEATPSSRGARTSCRVVEDTTSPENANARNDAGIPSPSSSDDGDYPMENTPEEVAELEAVNVESPQGQLLLGSNLHKVYVGETASLSYLSFLRRIVEQRIGPCDFTQNELSDYMMESRVMPFETDPLEFPDAVSAASLIDSYLDATSGVLDVYSRRDLVRAVRRRSQNAGCYLALAVGAQCRSAEIADVQLATRYFARGRSLAFETMLAEPSLDLVAQFLVMAFYMLGACNRNAAYMYTGIALKAAKALGLHRADQYRNLPPEERDIRLGIWKSCRALDMMINIVLGRHTGSIGTKDEQSLLTLGKTTSDADNARSVALQAAFELCPLMDELHDNGSNQSFQSADALLKRLHRWDRSLPDELRRCRASSRSVSPQVSQQFYIGAAHVTGIYLFAVILSTRHFLTAHLLPRVRDDARARPGMPKTNSELNESMALVCLDAAVKLANVGYHALSTGRILSNMCMIKAWMFAAGLMLGFSLFAQLDHADKEIEEAFNQARDVLQHTAACSPLAGHYTAILVAFSDAIHRQQRRLVTRRKQMAGRYLDSMFAVDDLERSTTMTSPNGGSDVSREAPSLLNNQHAISGASDVTDGTDVLSDLQQYALSIDDLGLEWQPFAPFFEPGIEQSAFEFNG